MRHATMSLTAKSHRLIIEFAEGQAPQQRKATVQEQALKAEVCVDMQSWEALLLTKIATTTTPTTIN